MLLSEISEANWPDALSMVTAKALKAVRHSAIQLYIIRIVVKYLHKNTTKISNGNKRWKIVSREGKNSG